MYSYYRDRLEYARRLERMHSWDHDYDSHQVTDAFQKTSTFSQRIQPRKIVRGFFFIFALCFFLAKITFASDIAYLLLDNDSLLKMDLADSRVLGTYKFKVSSKDVPIGLESLSPTEIVIQLQEGESEIVFNPITNKFSNRLVQGRFGSINLHSRQKTIQTPGEPIRLPFRSNVFVWNWNGKSYSFRQAYFGTDAIGLSWDEYYARDPYHVMLAALKAVQIRALFPREVRRRNIDEDLSGDTLKSAAMSPDQKSLYVLHDAFYSYGSCFACGLVSASVHYIEKINLSEEKPHSEKSIFHQKIREAIDLVVLNS